VELGLVSAFDCRHGRVVKLVELGEASIIEPVLPVSRHTRTIMPETVSDIRS
jgi:hypothetical protein